MQQANPQQLLSQMRECYAPELAHYERLRKLVGSDLKLTYLLTKAVENLRVASSDDTASDEVHLLFARFTFAQMYSVFIQQLMDEGYDMFDNIEVGTHRLFSFIACTPQEELEYLFQGHYEDASLGQLMGV